MIPWESCVLWFGYPLQNGVWPDISKHNNNGIITGAFWEGDSFDFDGIDDIVNCGTKVGSQIGVGNFTTEIWIRWYDKAYSYIHDFASNILGTAVAGTGNGIGASVGELYCYDGSLHLTGVIISPAIWYHIAVVRTGTGANQTHIYLDGTLVYSFTEANDMSGTTFYIAQYGFSTTNRFKGHINHVRIYDIGLTTEQIKESYQQTYRIV
jgi:hypothetical protein